MIKMHFSLFVTRMKCMVGSKIFKKYLFLLVLLFISALNFNAIIKPNRIVAGGINGLAIILNYLLKIDLSLIILFLQLCILLLSYFFLDRNKLLSSFMTTFIYPFFVWITNFFTFRLIINSFFIPIIGGIISGFVTGYICRMEFSVGGFIVIAQILNKKFHLSIAFSNFLINIMIIMLGELLFQNYSIISSVTFLFFNYLIMKMCLFYH